jgi:enamine deaminase RidA (YjgF/YER057c/UK114 family)
MASKIEVTNPNAVSVQGVFNWGLRVKQAHEWYYISGHVDVKPDWQVGHPGDPLAQTRAIFKDLEAMLERAGYSLEDVVKVETTVTPEYNLVENLPKFLEIFAETFQAVAVKPSAGTLRVVEALAIPGVFIEIEMVAAR